MFATSAYLVDHVIVLAYAIRSLAKYDAIRLPLWCSFARCSVYEGVEIVLVFPTLGMGRDTPCPTFSATGQYRKICISE